MFLIYSTLFKSVLSMCSFNMLNTAVSIFNQYIFSCPSPAQANSTLQEFANLRHYSQDWIKSSNYIMKSSEILSQTLPMLQVQKLTSLCFLFDSFCCVTAA